MSQTRYEAVVFDDGGVLTVPIDGGVLDRAVATAFAAFGVDADATQVEAVQADPRRESSSRSARATASISRRSWRRHEKERAAAQRVALRREEEGAYGDVSALSGLPSSASATRITSSAAVPSSLTYRRLRRFDIGPERGGTELSEEDGWTLTCTSVVSPSKASCCRPPPSSRNGGINIAILSDEREYP